MQLGRIDNHVDSALHSIDERNAVPLLAHHHTKNVLDQFVYVYYRLAAYVAIVLAMTAEAVPTRLTGAAIGFNGVAFSIGGTIGPPLFGLVLDHAGSYGMAWLTLGAVLLAGAGILAFGYRERPPPTAEP